MRRHTERKDINDLLAKFITKCMRVVRDGQQGLRQYHAMSKEKAYKHSETNVKSWTVPEHPVTTQELQRKAEEMIQGCVTEVWSGITRKLTHNESDDGDSDSSSDDDDESGSSTDLDAPATDNHIDTMLTASVIKKPKQPKDRDKEGRPKTDKKDKNKIPKNSRKNKDKSRGLGPTESEDEIEAFRVAREEAIDLAVEKRKKRGEKPEKREARRRLIIQRAGGRSNSPRQSPRYQTGGATSSGYARLDRSVVMASPLLQSPRQETQEEWREEDATTKPTSKRPKQGRWYSKHLIYLKKSQRCITTWKQLCKKVAINKTGNAPANEYPTPQTPTLKEANKIAMMPTSSWTVHEAEVARLHILATMSKHDHELALAALYKETEDKKK